MKTLTVHQNREVWGGDTGHYQVYLGGGGIVEAEHVLNEPQSILSKPFLDQFW